ncbi:hypothetical protein GXP71_15320 [Cellulomonas sp. H30R-01]|uniref:hypothetical protein n=1 Tax=Cellulomonas sp. H30R-01 TaxID=2704467 RepID=UPI00138D3036|nr:hypothetical protein [Cellulomonas sp. H30R-01]QHT57308.1 hypothetical protein GXP71_15320 [Cellulomonas sp. H30R-01]
MSVRALLDQSLSPSQAVVVLALVVGAFLFAGALATDLPHRRRIYRAVRSHPERPARWRAAVFAARWAPASPRGGPDRLRHRIRLQHMDAPGLSFLAPARATRPQLSAESVQVMTTVGSHLLVVHLGRLGDVHAGEVIVPADERARDFTGPDGGVGWTRVGTDVLTVPSAAGTWYRSTITGRGVTLTDSHVDKDGHAFVVGVLTAHAWFQDPHDVAVARWDRMLTTFAWTPSTRDGGASRAE